MAKLEKGLQEWVSLGFISQDQAQRIKDYESNKPESSWILSGLLILGAVIVGIGVISLIAANWFGIPASLKLSVDFILLVGLAISALKSWDQEKLIRFEVLLLFFLLLCLASIGLISQIYHTGGKLYQALLLWSLITSAAALSAKRIFVPFMWTGAFFIGAFFAAIDNPVLKSIFYSNYPAIFMSLTLFCAGFAILSKNVFGAAGSTRALWYWTLIGVLSSLFSVELQGKGADYYGMSAYIPGYVLAAIVALAAWQDYGFKSIQKFLIFITVGVFLVPFHFQILDVHISILNATFTILIIGLISVFLASLKERRLFQFFLLLCGLRFLILYFQALGGLATTGIGLIISGGMVIGLAVLWNKYRTTIAAWTERWVQ